VWTGRRQDSQNPDIYKIGSIKKNLHRRRPNLFLFLTLSAPPFALRTQLFLEYDIEGFPEVERELGDSGTVHIATSQIAPYQSRQDTSSRGLSSVIFMLVPYEPGQMVDKQKQQRTLSPSSMGQRSTAGLGDPRRNMKLRLKGMQANVASSSLSRIGTNPTLHRVRFGEDDSCFVPQCSRDDRESASLD